MFGSTKFRSDEKGSIAIIGAFTLLVCIGAVGMAVDGIRWFSMRRLHASAVDAALLSGARYLQLNPGNNSGAIDAAMSFYTSTIGTRDGLVNNSIAFDIVDGGGAITVTGEASIKTTFMAALGISQLDVASPGKAVIGNTGSGQGSDMEIALMLDVTGSMCDNGTGPCTTGLKIDGVKKAATDLAAIMLNQPSGGAKVRIGVVPFSSAIRIDKDGTSNPLMQTLTGLSPTWSGWMAMFTCTGGSGYYAGEQWVETSPSTCTMKPQKVSGWKQMPCVTERTFDATGFDPSDRPPGAGNWIGGHGGDRFPLAWDSSDTNVITAGNAADPHYSGQSAADPTYQWDYSPDGSGCMSQPGNEIVPLTTDLSAVKSRIDQLTAFGPTAGALGHAFTQYVLSPKWAGVWSGGSAPGSYADTQAKLANGAPVLRKIAILMTDGGYNTSRQWSVAYASDGGSMMRSVSKNAVDICTNMKANGIEIFTVGFNLDALNTSEQTLARSTLEACGTDISHFYDSRTVADLDATFKDIALRATPVRLSQ